MNERLGKILERIQSAGGKNVKLVAAVKSQSPEIVSELISVGIVDLGESYAQEFLQRQKELDVELAPKVNWHFIGQLQTNKVKLLTNISLFQSVDRKSLMKEIAKHHPNNEILVQLDTTNDPKRGGASADEVPKLVELAFELGLKPKGIMLIARKEPENSIQDFRLAAKIKESLNLEILSAGMSDDFELAIGEGSNMVRLGRILFP